MGQLFPHSIGQRREKHWQWGAGGRARNRQTKMSQRTVSDTQQYEQLKAIFLCYEIFMEIFRHHNYPASHCTHVACPRNVHVYFICIRVGCVGVWMLDQHCWCESLCMCVVMEAQCKYINSISVLLKRTLMLIKCERAAEQKGERNWTVGTTFFVRQPPQLRPSSLTLFGLRVFGASGKHTCAPCRAAQYYGLFERANRNDAPQSANKRSCRVHIAQPKYDSLQKSRNRNGKMLCYLFFIWLAVVCLCCFVCIFLVQLSSI